MKLIAFAAVALLSFSVSAFAGKFRPVDGEDWPDSAEPKSDAGKESDDDSEDGNRDPAASGMPEMPKIKMLPDGSPDPESMRQFLK